MSAQDLDREFNIFIRPVAEDVGSDVELSEAGAARLIGACASAQDAIRRLITTSGDLVEALEERIAVHRQSAP